MDFNASITHAMAKTMEHLSDFVFVLVANTTLARRDFYLSHLKSGMKLDTLASMRTAPLQMATLFPDDVLKQAEQDIANSRILARKVPSTHTNVLTGIQTNQPGKRFKIVARAKTARARPPTIHHDQSRGSSHINDNYCVNVLQIGMLPRSKQNVNTYQLPQFPEGYQKDEHSDQRQFKCKLKCCYSCTYCKRVFAK